MSQVALPSSLDQLWPLMDRWPGAALYAGGTDLLVRRRQGLADPPALICLERIAELKLIEQRGDHFFLGAGASHAELLEHPLVQEHLPVLAQALAVLGSPPIRRMGTLGGNLVTASPAGDTLPPLYALEAQVQVRARDSERSLALSRFILGPGQVDLRPGEIVTGVWAPIPHGFNLQHFEKVGLRRALAIAVASLAALLAVNGQGVIEKARLSWGSVGPKVITSSQVEQALIGRPLSLPTLQQAARLAREQVSPIDDLRASAAYRRQVAGNLLLRLMERASPKPE